MDFSQIWLLPVGVAIATLYTSSGISGANFWVPVYLLVLGLDPAVSFWLALVSMLFGSSSGMVRHARQRTIDYREGLGYLLLAAPAAVVGARLRSRLDAGWLVAAFGVFVLAYGIWLWARQAPVLRRPSRLGDGLTAIVGGFGVGTISVGLGAVLLPRCLAGESGDRRGRAVGTVLLTVFLTSLAAALASLSGPLLDVLRGQGSAIAGLLVFVVPGVVLGGQIGPRLARRLDRRMMRRYAAALLTLVGGLMLARAWQLLGNW